MAKITKKAFMAKLDKLLSGGLFKGKGDGINTMCAEQAVAAAAGEPITDSPACALPAAVAPGRYLNDSFGWKSDRSRAAGMRPFLLAQFGTAGKDPKKFAKEYVVCSARMVAVELARRSFASDPAVQAAADAVEKEVTPATLRDLAAAFRASDKATKSDPEFYLRASAQAGAHALKTV